MHCKPSIVIGPNTTLLRPLANRATTCGLKLCQKTRVAKTFERRALKNNKVKKKKRERGRERANCRLAIYIAKCQNRNASQCQFYSGAQAEAQANGVTFAGPCRKASGMQHAIAAKSAAWHQSSKLTTASRSALE